MKIRQAESFSTQMDRHVGREADRHDKANSRFSQIRERL